MALTRETQFTDLAAYTYYINNVSSITNTCENNRKAEYKKQNTKGGQLPGACAYSWSTEYNKTVALKYTLCP